MQPVQPVVIERRDVTRGQAKVLTGEGIVTCEALDVLPVGITPPRIEDWSCELEGGMRHTGVNPDAFDLSELNLDARTRTFRYPDSEDRWITVTYDPTTEVRSEAPSRTRSYSS